MALRFSFVRFRVVVDWHIQDVDVGQVITSKQVTRKRFMRKQTAAFLQTRLPPTMREELRCFRDRLGMRPLNAVGVSAF
jgi:hypothetical protein